jgi:predicted nucleotidyltransferase
MDFKQIKKLPKNEEQYRVANLRISREFSKELLKEFGELVRSIVLFGSNTNNTQNKNSDIDLFVILDNVSIYVNSELREAYKIITDKLNKNIGKNKVHLTTINLSDFWQMSRIGDPILINILRFGVPLFDRDLIEPHQYLLEIGKIRPTLESIYNYKARAETLLNDTKLHLENSIMDLYYCVVDIIHSSLMVLKITPPSPKEMPQIFKKAFRKEREIYMLFPIIQEIYKKAKEIEHKNLDAKVTGKLYDNLNLKSRKIVKTLSKFIDEELKKRDLFNY